MIDLREVALTIPCSYCAAPANVTCSTATGKRSTYLHGARTAPIYDAYGGGYQEGCRDGLTEAAGVLTLLPHPVTRAEAVLLEHFAAVVVKRSERWAR